jgi:hypothetical protein
MKKLIITTCVVASMVVLPMSNTSAGCNWNEQQGQWVGNCSGNAGSHVDNTNINLGINRNNNHNFNNNVNHNNNRNTNTNVNTQAQGQNQSVNNTNDVDVDVNIDNSGNEGSRDVGSASLNVRGYRGFANPAVITYPETPSYFGPATKNPNVQPAKVMTMFKDTFTRGEVEKYLEIVNIDHARRGEVSDDVDKSNDQTIKVVFDPPAKNTVVQTALITMKSTSKHTNSKDVLYAVLLSGLDSGADIVFITAEGASTYVQSFGWGIGMSYTRATISTDERGAQTGGGGMGISASKAGYQSLPWIRAIGLKLK